MLRATLLALSLALSAPQVSADAFEDAFDDALSAYDRGEFDTVAKTLRKLADQGFAPAQSFLGEMYEYGEGVSQNYEEALKWYLLAAEQGDGFGQANIGFMYDNGFGVAQDNIMARMWYDLASYNGIEVAELLSELSARMTVADILKAQALAQACMSNGYKNCGY